MSVSVLSMGFTPTILGPNPLQFKKQCMNWSKPFIGHYTRIILHSSSPHLSGHCTYSYEECDYLKLM